jgi:hypothetical protein
MLYSSIFKMLFKAPNSEEILLGRWGYHWEINRKIQKYYE